MNWAAWGPTLVAIVTAIFSAGLTVGRLRGQEKTQREHRSWLLAHDDVLKDHGTRLAKSEGWREGFAAARREEES
jgi:hypothetical protein